MAIVILAAPTAYIACAAPRTLAYNRGRLLSSSDFALAKTLSKA